MSVQAASFQDARMYYLDPQDRFRIEIGARHLHQLGARAVAEFLGEGVASGDDVRSLIDRLQRYQRCDPAVVRAVGGDRLPRRRLTLAPPQ
jgi:hypothetical protein